MHCSRDLAKAGVIHPDLNVKNILLARDTNGVLQAGVIDVDTIQWDDTARTRRRCRPMSTG
jgi:Ser/Thr protein kinase RdoA (MazF antagonist)